MSHGGGGAEDYVEPDLTPLLDMVLQILMFFIVNVNFVSEQVSNEVRLPESESARPIDKADPAALFLNQKVKTEAFLNRLEPDLAKQLRADRHHSLVLIPTQPPMTLDEAKRWLKDRYEMLDKLTNGNVQTVINFRPDGDLELTELFTLMKHCQTAGFTRLKIRANVRREG